MKNSIIILTAFLLTSCVSSQKKLQRRIEKNGIKESITFVQQKYPEYFKSKDTTIHDTIVKHDTIEVEGIDTSVVLADSLHFLTYYSDSLKIIVNKLTNSVKVQTKTKYIYLKDTIYRTVKCPEIKCPDCEDLKDYTKKERFSWKWLLVLIAFGIIIIKVFRYKIFA